MSEQLKQVFSDESVRQSDGIIASKGQKLRQVGWWFGAEPVDFDKAEATANRRWERQQANPWRAEGAGATA